MGVEEAAFQLGTSSKRLLRRTGKIKTLEQVEEEKMLKRAEEMEAKRATSAKPKLSPLEQQIKKAEKNEERLSEYERMRLRNMRERVEMLKLLDIVGEKEEVKELVTVPKRLVKREIVLPREKSGRIRRRNEKREAVEEESKTAQGDRLKERKSPSWVGKHVPAGATDLDIANTLTVPPVTVGLNEIFGPGVEYHKGERSGKLCYRRLFI